VGRGVVDRGRRLVSAEIVGRDEERATLDERLDAAARGRGGVVVLLGQAGVGKSRLARDVTDTAVARGVRVLSGRAVPGPSPLP
jgi:predicted ATPase